MNLEVNKSPYTWEGCNNSLNQWSDAFSEKIVLPAMKSSYDLMGNIVSLPIYPISSNLYETVQKYWYDPLSTHVAVKFTKPVEVLAGAIASRKAIGIRGLNYLDTCLISSAQHLYAYVKEVNYLLELPKKLKHFAKTLSFDQFFNKLSKLFGRVSVLIIEVILAFKYLVLKIIDLVLFLFDLFIGFFDSNDFSFMVRYSKDIVHNSINKIHGKFYDVALKAIETRENAVRKELVASATYATAHYFVTTFNQAAIRVIIGGVLFWAGKSFLEASVDASSYSTNLVGLAVLGKILWSDIVKPKLDSYYETYDHAFDVKASYLMRFCEQHSITYLFPPLKILQDYTSD